MTARLLARVVARGHPAIRATHDATLELAEATDITERATCVIGVGATVVEGGLGGLVGPVRATLTVDGDPVPVFDVVATANPTWHPGDGLVLRRSTARGHDTIATESPVGARDLPRTVAARLRDPATALTLELRVASGRADGRPLVVLVGDGGPTAEAWLHAGHPVVGAGDAGALEAAARTLAGGVLVVHDASGWPGLAVPALVRSLGAEPVWDTAGLSPEVGLANVLGGDGPVVIAPAGTGSKAFEGAMQWARRGGRVVGALSAARARALLARTRGAEPPAAAALALRWNRPDRSLVRGRPDDVAGALAGERHDLLLGLSFGWADGSGGGGEEEPVPPAVVRALLDAGVPARTVVDVLTAATGARRNAVTGFVRRADGDRTGGGERP